MIQAIFPHCHEVQYMLVKKVRFHHSRFIIQIIKEGIRESHMLIFTTGLFSWWWPVVHCNIMFLSTLKESHPSELSFSGSHLIKLHLHTHCLFHCPWLRSPSCEIEEFELKGNDKLHLVCLPATLTYAVYLLMHELDQCLNVMLGNVGLLLMGQSYGVMQWLAKGFPINCHSESTPTAITLNPILLLCFSIGGKCVITWGEKSCNANMTDLLKLLAAVVIGTFHDKVLILLGMEAASTMPCTTHRAVWSGMMLLCFHRCSWQKAQGSTHDMLDGFQPLSPTWCHLPWMVPTQHSYWH